MVNFRFHLVSLTAVFLALALGLAIGSTVVDRVTVDVIEARLEDVRERAEATNARNDELQAELDLWRRFAEQAEERVVQGRLRDVPVLVVTVAGGPGERLDDVQQLLVAAGAIPQGRLMLTEKWRLTSPEDIRQLASIAGTAALRRDAVVRAGAVALARDLAREGATGGPTEGTTEGETGAAAPAPDPQTDILQAMRDAGFVQLDGPANAASVPARGSRFVVLSDDDVAVPNAQLLVPFVQELARLQAPVIAAQPSSARADGEAQPPTLVGALRRGPLATSVSTVDNLDSFQGLIAAVLAVQDLAAGRTGHYGVGEGATALLPEARP